MTYVKYSLWVIFGIVQFPIALIKMTYLYFWSLYKEYDFYMEVKNGRK